MKDWKKFLAFGLTTVLAAGAVVFITPAVRAVADSYTQGGDGYTQSTDSSSSASTDTSRPVAVATKAQPSGGGGSSDGSGYGAVAAGELTSINADGQVVRTFVDLGGSKTMIAGSDGIIPTGSKFFAIPAKPDSATYQAATTIMAHWRPAAQVKEVFDFNVMAKGGDYIRNLDGSVTMSLPVPEDLVVPDGSILVVYRFNPDGTVTPCETLIDKGRVVWGTDAFGTFAFVIEKIPTKAN